MSDHEVQVRMTQFAKGGGCSCKVSPGELEAMLADAYGGVDSMQQMSSGLADAQLLCGLEGGDDATVVQISANMAIIATTDFFPPVVDDAYDWGRIAAANALSDVYAMGGSPLAALNLLAWPTDRLSSSVAAQVLRGGGAVAQEAGCFLAGGHSIVDPTPKYGLAVTGLADPDRLLRNDAARPGDCITLTKPLGLGVLNNLHKTKGFPIDEAIAIMATLNRDASRAALKAGAEAATDVTGFGLLGHLHKMARASGVTAVIEAAAVSYIDGARDAAAAGYIPGGTRRNLEWVAPHLDSAVPEAELLLLADAQTSGGLLVAAELPGYSVIGEFVASCGPTIVVR